MNRADAAEQIVADLRELAVLTSDEGGAQRLSWTPVWQQATEWFRCHMEAAGAEVSMDAVGNIWAKFAGESEASVVVGSHIDSVPDGGWLDGALGVAAGMGYGAYCLAGKKPKKTLYVVGWVDEEGMAFGKSCFGSAVASGSMTAQSAASLTTKDGRSFADVLRTCGLDGERIDEARAAFAARQVQAYLELHIEQAPLLAQNKTSAACVYGVCGCHREYITFTGQQSHCGSPVALRRDAFLAAAEATVDFNKIALKYGAYCTVGQVDVAPNVVTISPGRCRISLDIRCIDKETFQTMIDEARAAYEGRAREHGVAVAHDVLWHKEPVLFDETLKELCRRAVQEETGRDAVMYSAPLHDAVEMVKAAPSIMMFVMSDPGISHCKEEDTPEPALKEGIRAFLRLIEAVLGR